MKKVMIAVTTLFGGGAERVVTVWAGQLADMGYDVSLLLYGRVEREYPISDKVRILTVADTYAEYKKLGYFARLGRMRKLIKEEKPDIIISFLPRMQIWMMMAGFGIKTFRVETVRVSPWEVCSGSRGERFLWNLCFKRANAIIVQTAEQAEYFSKRDQKKCVVIPNPISKVCVEEPKTEYSEKATRFIAAGRLTSQKNFPMLIEAFSIAHKAYPDIRLSIYGTGDDEYIELLSSKIAEYGMGGIITLEGRTDDMHGALVASDAFLMSSNYEGMPNALAEAMAVGLVCASTNCRTGPKDLIDDGISGYLTETGNAELMANAIIKIAKMPKEELVKMGGLARAKVTDLCSEANSLNKLVNLIENGLN